MICIHFGIEVTQNNVFLAGNVPDYGCNVLVEHSFVSGVADSVGAYTLIRVTGPVAGLGRRARSRSEQLLPGSASLSKLLLTANPIPCSLGSLEHFPCQKNM